MPIPEWVAAATADIKARALGIWEGSKWKILFILALLAAIFFCFKWLTKPQEKITLTVDHAVTIYGDRVVFKDRIIYKPIEGSVGIGADGTTTIQQKGLCFIPKAGVQLVPGEAPRNYIGARIAFLNIKRFNFGTEVGMNDKRALAGVDLRIPFFQTVLISGGATSRWADLTGVGIYGAASIALR